jgi:hypothetical protein
VVLGRCIQVRGFRVQKQVSSVSGMQLPTIKSPLPVLKLGISLKADTSSIDAQHGGECTIFSAKLLQIIPPRHSQQVSTM